jgi:hypothetical protein
MINLYRQFDLKLRDGFINVSLQYMRWVRGRVGTDGYMFRLTLLI